MPKTPQHHYASARHLSCQGCRTRKQKCSRTYPCVSCAVKGIECVWQDTAPTHGIIQTSLDENLSEIVRLNKVVRQLQALLTERDGRASQPPSTFSVITPPTPPGFDYLPDPHVHFGGACDPSPTRPALPRTYSTPATSAPDHFADPIPVPAPPMMRTQSEYGYTFGSAPAEMPLMGSFAGGDAAEYPAVGSAYAVAPMIDYQYQQLGVGGSDEAVPLSTAPGRARATTWPTLTVLDRTGPAEHPHQPPSTGVDTSLSTSFSLREEAAVSPSSSSPISLGFDAAVTLASGLVAPFDPTEAPAHDRYFASEYLQTGRHGGEVVHEDLASAGMEGEAEGQSSMADLSHLASLALLEYRRPSTDLDHSLLTAAEQQQQQQQHPHVIDFGAEQGRMTLGRDDGGPHQEEERRHRDEWLLLGMSAE
ncbi:hypothetical protein JCM8202_000906 [Rhodotorula sphaerocarpa]